MPLSLGPAVDRHSYSRPAVGATGMHDRTNCKDLPSRARENATVKFSILDSLAEATSGSPFRRKPLNVMRKSNDTRLTCAFGDATEVQRSAPPVINCTSSLDSARWESSVVNVHCRVDPLYSRSNSSPTVPARSVPRQLSARNATKPTACSSADYKMCEPACCTTG